MLIMIVRWLCEREQCEWMSGWYPSSSCAPLNGGGVCCCAGLSGPVAWLAPCLVRCVAVSTAVMSRTAPLPCAWCDVGDYLSEVFVWWDILCLPPPRRGGGWAYRWVVGGMTRWGGMTSEGRVLLY